MLFTKVPLPRRDTAESLFTPQVTITAPSQSTSNRDDVRRSHTLPILKMSHFRDTLSEKGQYYGSSSEDEMRNLHPPNQRAVKHAADMDEYIDAHSGDETEASESSTDFAEAVGSVATNTILGFDIHEQQPKKSPPSPQASRHKIPHAHFSPIPIVTSQPVKAPVSALTALIKAKEHNSQEENHLAELYASFSGKGDLKPLHLKIYRPTGDEPTVPLEVVLRQDATVAEAIGFSLYRYWEAHRKPPLKKEECDANVWTLRIMEDEGLVDEDFPALERIRPISRFQFDMFALVEATPEQGLPCVCYV